MRFEIVNGAESVKLDDVLDGLTAKGWEIRFILPNGINRWTVIASKAA